MAKWSCVCSSAVALLLAAVRWPGAKAACDLGPNSEFAQLRDLARGYYESGSFEYRDAERVSQVLSFRDHLRQECPAAVLQALLLKLEENLVYEPHAFEHVLGSYVEYMHSALEDGTISKADISDWPLREGFQRAKALNARLSSRGRSTSSAMVMNFCAAADRFGEMHELQWLSEPPFGDPAESAQRGGVEMGLLKNTELYIYLVDAPKCKWLGGDIRERLERAVKHVHLIPYQGGPEREEQTAYFKYLADQYHELPEWTIFVHPDAPEHQGGQFLALVRALRLMATGSALAHDALQYYPIAQQLVVEPVRTWGASYAAEWHEFWDAVFDKPWEEYGFHQPRCRWAEREGTFLAGLVDGAEEGISRDEAKRICVAVGSACAGVTCGTPDDSMERVAGRRTGTCSARAGAGGPLPSPGAEEVSFTKMCSREVPRVVSTTSASAKSSGGPAFKVHGGHYLAGYAAGDAEDRLPDVAAARCIELGTDCAGYTCDARGALCSVRGGRKLFESPAGEIAYVKQRARYPGPTRGPQNATFQMYTGSQAVVHRNRLQAWPRSAFGELGADGPFCSKFSGLYEAVWHAMFGEPLAQAPREHDPRLPLYLKWQVPTYYSFGDEGVI